MADVDLLALRLAHRFEGVDKPWRINIKRLAAFDSWELNGAEDVTVVLVMTDDPRLPLKGALDCKVGTGFDQAKVVRVGGGCAGKIP